MHTEFRIRIIIKVVSVRIAEMTVVMISAEVLEKFVIVVEPLPGTELAWRVT